MGEMNELKFNSAICTTKEQSQRLLDLGLKPETADMYYLWLGGNDYRLKVDIDNNPLKYNMDKTYIPAWSLHRLIEMCNKNPIGMTISIYNDEVTVDGDLFEVLDNTYDNLISVIEWLIKEGRFNKEYLKQ